MTTTNVDEVRAPGNAGRTARVSPVTLVVGVLALATLAVLVVRPALTESKTNQEIMAGIDQTAFAAETGVEIDHVVLIGGGGLIEIRYRIINVERSDIVHSIEYPPRIVHDGFEMRVPRHEHSHVRINRIGASYTEQVVNLGGLMESGDIVTVYIGESALEGVPLQ